MPIADQLVDQLLGDYEFSKVLMIEQGLLHQLTKKLAERAFEAEIEQYLG